VGSQIENPSPSDAQWRLLIVGSGIHFFGICEILVVLLRSCDVRNMALYACIS